MDNICWLLRGEYKMNNKGFMMAEVVIVASIVMVTLVGFYTSYNKIISLYNQRINYYDVATLYELANIREAYKEELSGIGSTGNVISENNTEVFYVDMSKIKDMLNSGISETFKDYVTFLSTSLEVETESILIMEKCSDDDNCKYAYLEVFNDETSE